MDITHTTNCPHGRTDGLACYGHTDPARDCPPPCCEVHRDGFSQPREDCPECMAALSSAFDVVIAGPPLPHRLPSDAGRIHPARRIACYVPGCGAEAGPLPGPKSGRDLCPEHRDDERHELERAMPEPLPDDGPFSRPALLRVAREELAAAEVHLATALAIQADGSDAHSVPYWEREVGRLNGQVERLEPGPAYWCKRCRKAVAGTIRADSEPPHFERHFLTAGPDRGMSCGPVVRLCEQCGAAGAITVTDAGDFCSCGAEVQA